MKLLLVFEGCNKVIPMVYDVIKVNRGTFWRTVNLADEALPFELQKIVEKFKGSRSNYFDEDGHLDGYSVSLQEGYDDRLTLCFEISKDQAEKIFMYGCSCSTHLLCIELKKGETIMEVYKAIRTV